MKDFYLDKFQYNFDTNQKLLNHLFENKIQLNDRIHVWVSHIVNAHEIWNTRILKEPTKFSVWQLHNYEDLLALDGQNFDVTRQIISSFSLDKEIDYKTSTGDFFKNKLEDLLYHVLNHSNYHRAQINSELKNLGLLAVSTDYVFYKRY